MNRRHAVWAAPAALALSLGVLFTPDVPLSSPGAETTIVSPETATELPKPSPNAVLLALR